MKVAIIGATGFLGSRLVTEFANRNFDVTAISRHPVPDERTNVNAVHGDVFKRDALIQVLEGHDVVVSAYNPGWDNPDIYEEALSGSKALQEAVKHARIKRYIYIGGAGSLYIAPDVQLIDTPQFPAEYKMGALAARDYLNYLKVDHDLDWVFFSPAIEMHAGITTGRTGKYRYGRENPVFDENGRSILSGEDVAVVIADEVENPKHHRERFTAAY